MSPEIRRIITIVEETRIEGGRPVDPPTRRAAAIAVIRNPYAGTFVEDLSALSVV
ncbi:MAG: amino acid synthesis family protein, partial [Mesorhizobium sp.]